MALPDTLLVRLIEVVQEFDLSGDFLMLGRQRYIGSRRGESATLFANALKHKLGGKSEDELRNPDDIYSERFFETLGFSSVNSMDISGFEGASIIQDLGGQLDQTLNQRFDVIYDGGTCEHIFDLPQAYRNIHSMLRPGGVFIGHSPCNNWINHSFYQLNPEIVFGFWENAMGYELMQLFLQPLRPAQASRTATVSNPNETGMRPQIIGELPKGTPLMMVFAARKPLDGSEDNAGVYQSDYVGRWERGEAAGQP